MKPLQTWISLDLEMNHDKDQNLTDIIQIGAVAFDIGSGKVKDSLNLLIKLPLDANNQPQQITPFITTLTGITTEMTETEGKSLWLGYFELVDFVERNNAHKEAVCWGGNDAQYLFRQLCEKKAYSLEKHGRFIFNSNYFDCKKFFQAYCVANDMDIKSGMAKSMRRMGLTFKGRIHNAYDDAHNCAAMFHFLMSKFKNQ